MSLLFPQAPAPAAFSRPRRQPPWKAPPDADWPVPLAGPVILSRVFPGCEPLVIPYRIPCRPGSRWTDRKSGRVSTLETGMREVLQPGGAREGSYVTGRKRAKPSSPSASLSLAGGGSTKERKGGNHRRIYIDEGGRTAGASISGCARATLPRLRALRPGQASGLWPAPSLGRVGLGFARHGRPRAATSDGLSWGDR